MVRRLAWLLSISLFSRAAAQEAAPRLSVSFAVDASEPESGKIRVVMTVHHYGQDELRVSIPAWAPGAYRIVKYCRQVSSVEATGAEGKKLDVGVVDEQTWSIKTGGAPRVTIRYELTVESRRMDREHCYLAGPDTYFYIVGHKETPCSVGFALPDGWRVGTGLEAEGPRWKARDYDTFIDCPTELGRFELYDFEEDPARYELVVHSKGPVDGPKLVEMCRKIVKEHNRMFGPPPFKRYVFLYHFKDSPGGRGLEHLNSTDIIMPYPAIKFEPLLAASVTSHEYFHLWNVKRIRPLELGPFDYTQIVRSKALWLCEGVTSYFGDRGLARCGIWKEEQYLAHLGVEVETLQNNPDRKVTPIEKASQSIWDRKDYPQVDYYNKGELLGLLIDLKMRTRSGGEKCLDDVLRRLYETYVVLPSKQGKGPIGVGYPEDGILEALNLVSGEDWSAFYDDHIRGVRELPFKEVLEAAGLATTLNVTESPDLGFDLRGIAVIHVPEGSPAQKAGVKAGDRIASIDDTEVTRSNLRELMAKLKPGDDCHVRLVQFAGEAEVTLKVGLKQRSSCKIRRAQDSSELQRRVLDGWLGKIRNY